MSLPDRILGALRALIREEVAGASSSAGVPAGAVFAPWEYSVAEATDSTVTARRADSSCPWPDVVQIPIYPGIAGARYRPAVGSIVGVQFANGDPSKPRIVWADQTVPVTSAIDGSSSVTVGASLTPVVSSSSGVVVSPGTVPAPPQAVAMAPAVTTFAQAAATMAAPVGAAFTALAAFAADVGTNVPATAATATAAASACTTAATACTTFAAAVTAVVGTFPTGITSTKLTTQ